MSKQVINKSTLSMDLLNALAAKIKIWGNELGFNHTAISDINLQVAENRLNDWIKQGHQGEMEYMFKHGTKRTQPAELVPGTLRVITVRMDYLPENQKQAEQVLKEKSSAYISRYALGRDYHKVIRKKLQQLAKKIESTVGDTGYRAFCDSAPVMEKALAEKSGQGWIGKHSNVLNRTSGSWFFLGELYTDLPLPVDEPVSHHCGSCTACIDICPTQAIVAPYVVDARKCISYLTIELHGSIPVEFRTAIGNRVYGCDDCQLICPWNKYASLSAENDFMARHQLNDSTLIDLFAWSESEFERNTEGSAIRRIGYERWLRNIAVSLGNSDAITESIKALNSRLDYPSDMVREHIQWSLEKLTAIQNNSNGSS